VTPGNFRRGTGCESDGNDQQEPQPAVPLEVMPTPSGRQQVAVALGSNGMVDARLFYLLVGVILGGGICMYCASRKN
jgi:hypothetical protein